MPETEIVRIVISALEIVSRAAPGFLAALTGTDSDEKALERARLALEAVPRDPAQRGIERWRRERLSLGESLGESR
jgi:hypothetical protein